MRILLLALALAITMPMQARKKKKDTAPPETEYHKVTGRDSANVVGVATVVLHDKKYYLEVPRRLMATVKDGVTLTPGRQFLVVNRMQQVPRELNDASASKGINYSNMVVYFEHEMEKGVVRMREQRPTPLVDDDQAIAQSVRDNYINPILASWDVKAMSPDSSTVVFPVHDLFNGEETVLNDVFNSINIGQNPNSKLSRLISLKAYDNNVVATSELTTVVHEGNEHINVGVVTTTSLCLLPEVPMRARESDPRVGYFSTPRLRYTDTQQRPIKLQYANRWRLEPKDPEAYMRGELSEPVKPITIYLDPSTPRHLRMPIKQGIEDWNVPFERAGFKNAVRVVMLSNDSNEVGCDTLPADFADDVKYSTLTYAAGLTANAMGPSLIDPRTGEILEADIMWWHNVSEVIIEWLRVQTTPYCEAARQLDMPDSLITQAARFVACHEMGHSLGLRHNFLASSNVPSDSLLSPSFVQRVGNYCPSIMDYARYNYVAQEGSGMTVKAPSIGVYDEYAIEWGYRWWPDDESERIGLQQLVACHRSPIYDYQGDQATRTAVDPRAMSEDLGDNPMRSATLGTENLKLIVPHIIEWTTSKSKSNQTYEDASALYLAVMGQWNRYNYHVLANIGGLYMDSRFVGDGHPAFRHVEKGRQKLAVMWLVEHAFTYPAWMFNTDITRFTYIIRDRDNSTVLQAPNQLYQFMLCYIMWDLLDNGRMMRMADNELANGEFAFTATEMMKLLHDGIFAETIKGNNINLMQRFVQKTFVDALITAASSASGVKIDKNVSGVDALLGDDAPLARQFMQSLDMPLCGHCEQLAHNVTFDGYGKQVTRLSDPLSVKRGELTRIEKLLRSRSNTGDQATRDHYSDLLQRIETALAPHY